MFTILLTLAISNAAKAGNDVDLKFNPNSPSKIETLTMPDGQAVSYHAYEHLFFVSNVEDSTYQYLNFYIPASVSMNDSQTPIFLRTYIGGYMASQAMGPSATDATGRALLEGYVVCIPGSRGRNSIINKKGKNYYTGRAPAAILDLKAALRYLHYNDGVMPGDANKIITDGTSAGGAMSALMGATGNASEYEPLLQKMGTAPAKDNVFASVCYCPITDLEHADIAYEWLYNCTNDSTRKISDVQKTISNELATLYPAYINSLGLKKQDGTSITADNYLDYVKSFLITSIQRAKNEGCDIPDSIGIEFNKSEMPHFGGISGIKNMKNKTGMPPMRESPMMGDGGKIMIPMGNKEGEFVTDIDMKRYLNYVVTTQMLKTAPAFDSKNVVPGQAASGENGEFGNTKGSSVNFTAFSITKATNGKITEVNSDIKANVHLLNPMDFIGKSEVNTAPHWYIRHGARDRDTSLPIPINLATKLMNNGYDVDFCLPWNRPHSGDYNLDDLFLWIKGIIGSTTNATTETTECENSPGNVLIIYYDSTIGKQPLLKSTWEMGCETIYDYKNFNAIAIRVPINANLNSVITKLNKTKGVLSVNRDQIMHLD